MLSRQQPTLLVEAFVTLFTGSLGLEKYRVPDSAFQEPHQLFDPSGKSELSPNQSGQTSPVFIRDAPV